jgi:DNA-binding MarR family transcriptional regulator
VTAMLDRLERLGHLARSPHPVDRRKVAVRITETTKQKAWDLYGPIAQAGDEVLAEYTAEELDLLAAFLRRSTELYEQHLSRLKDQPARERSR